MRPTRRILSLADPGPSDTVVKSIFGVPVKATDDGDEVAAWFSDLLGNSYRVVGIGTNNGWRLPEKMDIFGQPAAFVDAAPILVTTTCLSRWRGSGRISLSTTTPRGWTTPGVSS